MTSMISTVSSKLASRLRPRAAQTILPLGLALASGVTAAHAGPAADSPIAETLFREGKALMREGDFARGCPKLAESHRLDPASGTALALALCHDKQGKLASAWAAYLEAEALAKKDGSTERGNAARKRAAALEPKLARLEIDVPDATRELPGLEIRLDGTVLEQAVWGSPMPIDPGEHALEATAKGKERWTTTVVIDETADRQQIQVGPLVDRPPEPVAVAPETAPSPAAPPAAAGDADEGSDAAWITGVVVGGLGLAAAGVGAFFGVRALDQIGEAQDRCSPGPCTDPEAIDLNESGAQAADASTGLVIGGSVATVTGLILILTAALAERDGASTDEAAESALELNVVLQPAGGGVMLGGTW